MQIELKRPSEHQNFDESTEEIAPITEEQKKEEREGKVIEEAKAAPVASASKPSVTHTEARLRIQFNPALGKAPLTRTFPAATTLFEVAAAVKEEAGVDVNTLTTTFPPRRTFTI